MNFNNYKETIDTQIYIKKDVREIVFQNEIIKPYLRFLVPNYDVEQTDTKIRTNSHDYLQYCGTYERNGKLYPATPDLCIVDNWVWDNAQDMEYKATVEIKSPILDPITGFTPEKYKCKNEIKRHLNSIKNKKVILTDTVTWTFYDNKIEQPKVISIGELIYLYKDNGKAVVRTQGNKPIIKGIQWFNNNQFETLSKYIVKFLAQ